MKLHEIIDTEYLDDFKTLGPPIGSGREANVYNDKDDPHMIIKSIHKPANKAYPEYIQAIIDRGLTGVNPYVPRIYKRNKDSTKFGMEKLEPIYSIDNDELLPIMQKICDDEFVEKYKNSKFKADMIAAFITRVVEGHRQTKSKQLQQVVEIIRKLGAKYSGSDIWAENIMIRRTPYGLQLVLTDPIY